jgi:hypothetical protein
MRFRIIPLAAALLLLNQVSPAAAQELEVTVLGGLSSATQAGSGAGAMWLDGPARRNGLALGAGASLPVRPNLRASVQALYVAKGSREGRGDYDDDVMRIDYLDLPLLLIATLPVEAMERVTPVLMAGPVLSLKLNAELIEAGESFDVDGLKGTDLGFAMGGGIEVPAGRGRVAVLTRYVIGLQDVAADGGLWGADVLRGIRNRSFQLLVGYSFSVGNSH